MAHKKINEDISQLQNLIKNEKAQITKDIQEKIDQVLHDICIDLETCKRKISRNELREAKDELCHVKKTMSTCILEVRKIIYQLRLRANGCSSSSGGTDRKLSIVERLMGNESLKIAEVLHDTTLQKLATLLVGVQLCERLLSKDIRKVRMQIANLRNLALDTRREVAKFPLERDITEENFLLISALKEHLITFQNISNITVELRIKGKEDGISQKVKINLFKIIKEALTNIEKHAKANRVEIDLNMAGDRILATVADNGRGFDLTASVAKSRISGHLGLTWMDEKVRALEGTLTINTNPGKGTRIMVDIPNSRVS
ncbi:MAG: ATP-binding protein [Actinomycetota bacterium]|nr:ATP-binding protein [Actinomycetota bacterium]